MGGGIHKPLSRALSSLGRGKGVLLPAYAHAQASIRDALAGLDADLC